MADFNDACTGLLLREPFYGTLLMAFKHRASTSIPTLCVSLDTITYNPEFVATLDDDVGVAAIAHEILHAVYGHVERIAHYTKLGIGPDGKPFNAKKYNYAADYVDNACLHDAGFTLGENWLYSVGYSSTDTPEEVYCLIDDPPDEDESGGQFDSHDATELEDGALPAITPIKVMEAAATAMATRGKLPAGIERLLGTLRKPTVNPWQRLRRFVTSALSGHDATSWRRLHRKMIVRGVGMPGPVAQGAGHIGIVVDVSGSIDAEVLNLFAGHTGAIIDEARPRLVTLLWVDDALHRVDTLRSSTELRALLGAGFRAPGGGGTNMPVGVREAERLGCDCIIVLTDGYTPFCDSNKPLVWAITVSNNKASGNGETLHIT